MPTVQEFYGCLDQKAPFGTQLSYDNAGFLVGRGEREVKRVLISLDLTEAVAREAAAEGAQLVVTHHPVIFRPISSVTDESPAGRTLLALVEHQIAAICAHTNLDAAEGGVNDVLAGRLGVREASSFTADGIARAGTLDGGPMSFAGFAEHVKKSLHIRALQGADVGRAVSRVALCGGAGSDDLSAAAALGCDTYVTGDVKHHSFLEARALGINLIDAGHYATEQAVCGVLEAWLREAFPTVEIVQTQVHNAPSAYF